MKILKKIPLWLYKTINGYNVFIPDEDDYPDKDDDEVQQEPMTVLQRQKQATWLYTLLLAGSMYVLVYTAVTRTHSRTELISPVKLADFQQLHKTHHDTLSCPCSTSTISYRKFLVNKIEHHSVCRSFFVTSEWIDALYFENSSAYYIPDFRTTANAQFQLLASLCAFSMATAYQNELELNNTEVFTAYALLESQLQSEVKATISLFQNGVLARINSFLNYLRLTTRSNYFVSVLATNWQIGVFLDGDAYKVIAERPVYSIHGYTSDNKRESQICGTNDPTSPAEFSLMSRPQTFTDRLFWTLSTQGVLLVKGFLTGCIPFEALLRSSLDCLYDTSCLQLLKYYFPALSQLNVDWSQYVLHSNNTLPTMSTLLSNLFVEQQIISTDYSKYFAECSPSFCTFTVPDRTDLSYIIALFISLYSGPTIILRIVAPLIINILRALQHRFSADHIRSVVRWRSMLPKLMLWLKRLNLFKKINERSARRVQQQKLTTRIYLVLFTISTIVLLAFASLVTQTTTINVPAPSLLTFEDLHTHYADTLRCPCSNLAIPYQSFISLTPIFRQVCSSDFVNEQWITVLRDSVNDRVQIDWLNRGFSQFQLLSDLCQLAQQTVTEAVDRFLPQSFVTLNALTRDEFARQMNATFDQFFRSITIQFSVLVQVAKLLIQVDQPFMGFVQSGYSDNYKPLQANSVTDATSKLTFLLNGIGDLSSTSPDCVCAINPHCRTSVAIHQTITEYSEDNSTSSILYVVPGAVRGCSATESLLLSTLECFYSTSECFTTLLKYIQEIYVFNVEFPISFNFRPLIDNSNDSRSIRQMPISVLVENLMIERWDLSWSYHNFYQSCAPSSCAYAVKARQYTFFEVVLTLVSMVGGVSTLLRLITPLLVKFVYQILTQSKRPSEQQVSTKWLDRMKTGVHRLIALIVRVCVDLNIFPPRHFGSNADRDTTKRLGQWTTRLYFITLLSTLCIFAVCALVQPQALTSTFEKPSFEYYQQLRKKYSDELKCPCSAIASTYDRFVAIEPVFHQICSSDLVTDQWRENLTRGLAANLSIYGQRDYRRFLSAHHQFLQGLCYSSYQSVDISIKQLISSLFITTELLSEDSFQRRLSSSINQSQLSAPNAYNRLLSLIRTMNHGNAIVSAYGTNFEYIFPRPGFEPMLATTKSVIYDDGCICRSASNCITQATFIDKNTSVVLSGLKIGCLPSESFRLSTLQCYYEQSCLDLIQNYTNSRQRLTPLPAKSTRFLMNTTIDELIKNLFVEQWNSKMDYSSYFHGCSPLLCTYTYREQFDIFHTIIFASGFYGGLRILLAWLCPKIIRTAVGLRRLRQKREGINTSVVSCVTHSLGASANSVVSHNLPVLRSVPRISSSKRIRPIALLCMALMLIIILLTIYSISSARNKNNAAGTTVFSTIAKTSVTTLLTRTTTTADDNTNMPLSLCEPGFQPIVTSTPTQGTRADYYPLIGDFNNDHHLDFAYISGILEGVTVLLGDGQGNFHGETMFSTLPRTIIGSTSIADVNSDHNLDIVFTIDGEGWVSVLLGNGDGSFAYPISFLTGYETYSRDLVIAHFNNDKFLDLVVVNLNGDLILLHLGYGNGSFSEAKTISTSARNKRTSVALGYINTDSHADFAVLNSATRTAGVFLGDGQGNFESEIYSFTGGAREAFGMALGDVNGDHITDLIVSYAVKNYFVIMRGYANGTFADPTYVFMNTSVVSSSIALVDFNSDATLDIIYYALTMGLAVVTYAEIILSDGNGRFLRQTSPPMTFSADTASRQFGDFNGDTCADIIIFDSMYALLTVLLNACQCPNTKHPAD